MSSQKEGQGGEAGSQAVFAEIDTLSSRLEEEFAMIVDIPPGVRWGDLVL